MSKQMRELSDIMDRSNKGSDPFPRFIFSFLRAVDPYLQYLLIYPGYGAQLISKLGIAQDVVGPKGTVLIAMAAACSVKQIINILFISEIRLTYSVIVSVSLYETVCNSVASLSALVYGPSNQLGTLQYIGMSMFGVGILAELVSELQRKQFKDNPANKGKLYTGGLFSLARHINYGGYTLWRTGLALTSGNYWWAALQFFLHTYYFTTAGVPHLTDYCSKRYGEDWKKFERDVPNILIPYIW